VAGLFHTLGVGSESLYANRQGVDTTAHNIANAQTEGYSRQRVDLTQREPIRRNNLLIGNGVYAGDIKRSHDKFVERQLISATNAASQSGAKLDAMRDLESIFDPELTSTVSTELGKFFDSLHTLSVFPEQISSRTAVYEQAKTLSSSFQRTDQNLRDQRGNLNNKVASEADAISNMLETIAKLNIRIQELETGPASDANDLRDQRDLMVRALSEKIDIQYYEDKWGMVTIRGPGETLLVEGKQHASFAVRTNSENDFMNDFLVFDFEGGRPRNITSKVTGGSVGAMLDVRDNVVTNLLEKNHAMANSLVTEFNAVHRQGFGTRDFKFSNGLDFFNPLSDPSRAAEEIQVSSEIQNSTDAIAAASTPNAPGDNVIVNMLHSIKEKPIMADGSASLNAFFADYVGSLGIETMRAGHVKDADHLLKADLDSKRESVSGVSLDEEAANMIKWQTAFTASSKVITTVDEMLETVLSLKR
jgi:flagellar hook-associated protein 1 FlgK